MVIGETGHQNLPSAALPTIAADIGEALAGTDDLRGVSSLAAGADQLFAEQLLEHGGQLIVVVPSGGYESTFAEQDELKSFRQLLSRAHEIIELEFSEPSEEAFYAAGRRVVELSDRLIAVWDGQASRGLGGTADIVEYARQLAKPVEVIWPEGLVRD